MEQSSSRMLISSLWFQVALITFLFGFAVLGYLAYRLSWDQPPIPECALDETGLVVFNRSNVMRGQHVFQKYGLMQHGSIFGHGAYLGTDFTAQYLHRAAEEMLRFHSRKLGPGAAQAAVTATLKEIDGSGKRT